MKQKDNFRKLKKYEYIVVSPDFLYSGVYDRKTEEPVNNEVSMGEWMCEAARLHDEKTQKPHTPPQPLDKKKEERVLSLLQRRHYGRIEYLLRINQRDTRRGINLLASQYFETRGMYVEAIFCASHAEDFERISALIDRPEAREATKEYVSNNTWMYYGHRTPGDLVRTSGTDIANLLWAHDIMREAEKHRNPEREKMVRERVLQDLGISPQDKK